MVKWNEQQRAAIEHRGNNILVSAAAGSGKTAVLVERIKQLIISDKVSIDRFLIVTFTNAAAAEMKEKLIKAINEEIKANPADSAFLRRQLDLMSTANISTFHSFALEVMRRYFYLTDLEPDFKIGDEGTIEIIRRDVLDELFDDYFESENEEFLDFLKRYSSDRNERAVKENILDLYKTLQSIPHPHKWFAESVENLKATKEEFLESNAYKFIYEDLEYSMDLICEYYGMAMGFADIAGAEGIYEKCLEDCNQLQYGRDLLEKNDIEELGSFLKSFTPARLVPKKADKESNYSVYKDTIGGYRKNGKSIIDSLIKRYFTQSMDMHIEDLHNVYPQAKFLQMMMEDFSERFKQAKKSRKLIDFSDIEHYALEILENETVSAEYRDKFIHVFVDEYQDSNVMQDTLINLIKRENNLFVVGDVKQCIYKFRLAEPEIFRARYNDYADPVNMYSEKIDLNRNYRSKKSVIDTINEIFVELMKDYTDEAKLYLGDTYNGDISYNTELHVLDNQITKDPDIDNIFFDMKNAELEAHYVAGLIRDAVGTPIYDSKKGCERKATLNDIVILMRSTKDFAEIYQEVFKDLNIPSYVDESSGFFDTVEIQVFLNLLTIIDNMQQDVPLISVMHSAICDFTVDELVQIRLGQRRGSYYDALEKYKTEKNELGNKVRKFFDDIEKYRRMSQALPLEELVWNLMWETGYYTYCGALPAGRQRQANLKALADRARNYKDTGHGSIYGFLTYMRAIEKRQVPMGQVKLVSENENLVRIMTIHKSKGLEFPIVIVAGLGKRLNLTTSSGNFTVNKDFGVGMTRVSTEGKWKRDTFLKTLMDQKQIQDEREENIRVLYVALTRAKDRLILVGTGDFYKDGELKLYSSRASYIDYLVSINHKCNFKTVYFDPAKCIVGNEQYRNERAIVSKLLTETSETESDAFKELDRRLSFEYANKAAIDKKSKYSVTEFSKKGTVFDVKRDELKLPLFMHTESSVSAARKGTVMHKVMEVIDFRNAAAAVSAGSGIEYVNSVIDYMIEKEFITEDEREFIEADKIAEFFNTEVGHRAAYADELHKEAEFNFLKESDGVEVMVQGVIDCFFREGDKYVLVDYKNSYIDPERREEGLKRIKETYSSQVELYREALQLIKGGEVAESYLYLFSEGEFVSV